MTDRTQTAPEMMTLLRDALDRLSGLSDALRQRTTDELWESIPTWVHEHGYWPGTAAGATLTLRPQVSELVRITNLVAVCPGPAVLTLGGSVLPLPAGVTSAGVGVLLSGSDARTLVLGATGGDVALWLDGQQLAPTGNLAL